MKVSSRYLQIKNSYSDRGQYSPAKKTSEITEIKIQQTTVLEPTIFGSSVLMFDHMC